MLKVLGNIVQDEQNKNKRELFKIFINGICIWLYNKILMHKGIFFSGNIEGF